MKSFMPALRASAAVLCLGMAPSAHAGLFDNLLEALKPKPVVSFEAASSSVTEGGARSINLKLSRSSTREVALSYTRGGSAAAADYSATPATIQFAPGQTLKTISVTTVDDTQVEGAETLVLTLGTPGYGKLGTPAQHTLTIADNDVAPPTLRFSAATASGTEAQPSTVDVVLSAASMQAVSVSYATSGTATRPGDWQVAPSGTLTFAPGQTRKTLTITPVDDTQVESAETAILTLASPVNATLGSPAVHTRTILDNDAPPASGKWVTGYYVGYARDLYPVNVVDFSAMTHIVIGRVRPRADGTLVTDFDIDAVEGPRWAKQVVAAAHAAGTKAIVMLGGAGEYDGFVGAASNANRARFVANLVALANEYGFDGYDIDWEPIEVQDQPNVKKLAQDLRAAAPGKLLTIPIGWINNNFPEQAEPWYAEIAPLFDQINIMSYGMASGFWGWNTWHSSAIYGETGMTPTSIDSTVRHWLRVGVPAAKLGIGIGFYGSCWRGVTQPYQSTEGVDTGGLPINGNDDNDMSYTNIMTLYYNASAKRWHEAAKAPYLSSSTRLGPQRCNFISYEDPQSIAEKAVYVKQNGLGGTIVWTINQGYLPNAPAGQRDPLMQALKQGFRLP